MGALNALFIAFMTATLLVFILRKIKWWIFLGTVEAKLSPLMENLTDPVEQPKTLEKEDQPAVNPPSEHQNSLQKEDQPQNPPSEDPNSLQPEDQPQNSPSDHQTEEHGKTLKEKDQIPNPTTVLPAEHVKTP